MPTVLLLQFLLMMRLVMELLRVALVLRKGIPVQQQLLLPSLAAAALMLQVPSIITLVVQQEQGIIQLPTD